MSVEKGGEERGRAEKDSGVLVLNHALARPPPNLYSSLRPSPNTLRSVSCLSAKPGCFGMLVNLQSGVGNTVHHI